MPKILLSIERKDVHPRECTFPGATAADLLTQLNLHPNDVIMQKNGEFILQDEPIQDNDVIKIILVSSVG